MQLYNLYDFLVITELLNSHAISSWCRDPMLEPWFLNIYTSGCTQLQCEVGK